MNNNWALGWQSNQEGVANLGGFVQSTGTVTDQRAHVMSAVVRGAGQPSDFAIDGTLKASNTNGVTGPNGLAVNGFGYYNEPTDSEVAEIIVFPRALTTAERSTIELGLMAKWGTSASTTLSPGRCSHRPAPRARPCPPRRR